jgi:ElaB/YqjD/DUF883 family membrane-anchored ribosome-binding protein
VMHGGKTPIAKQRAAERIRDMLGEALDPNNALREAGRLAYSDIRELFDAGGKLIDNPKHWPDDIARAVASVEQDEITGNVDKGDGKRDRIIRTKVRLWDKPGNLENVMKTHGQLTEKMESTINVNIVALLQEGRKRVAERRGLPPVVVEGQEVIVEAAGKLLSDGRGKA